VALSFDNNLKKQKELRSYAAFLQHLRILRRLDQAFKKRTRMPFKARFFSHNNFATPCLKVALRASCACLCAPDGHPLPALA
jgi:hypothetical protein